MYRSHSVSGVMCYFILSIDKYKYYNTSNNKYKKNKQ